MFLKVIFQLKADSNLLALARSCFIMFISDLNQIWLNDEWGKGTVPTAGRMKRHRSSITSSRLELGAICTFTTRC